MINDWRKLKLKFRLVGLQLSRLTLDKVYPRDPNPEHWRTINGSKVQLVATQGSISQDYVDGVVNIGGRPQDMNSKKVNEVIAAYRNKLKDRTDKNYDEVKLNNMNAAKSDISDEEAGRIAGDSIYIAAADINVNGLIQSGFSKYVADITAEDLSEESIQKLKNNGSEG